MIKKILSLGALCILAFTANAARFTFNVANPLKSGKLTLTLHSGHIEKEVPLTGGKGHVTIEGFKPQYATLKYGYYTRRLYLEPDKDLTVTFDTKTFYDKLTFTGQETAVNDYLNNHRFAVLSYKDAEKPEAAFLAKADSVYNANISYLKKTTLPEAFKKEEATRLKYFSYELLPLYKTYYQYLNKVKDFTPTDAYYRKEDSLATIDAALLVYPEYKSFITYAVLNNAFRGKAGTDSNKAFTEYLPSRVKDPKVLEYITDDYIYGKVSGTGLDGADELVSFYHKYVKDPALTSRFDDLCAKWKALKAGEPSPSFSCPDINGKTVSLADLKGKFVYIDVWATWCGPCRGEIPHLKKLEEDYAGKAVAFVSLSCDQDKAAWQKMVVNDKLKGIQLYMGTKDDFMKKYIINGIPRFILLDKEGKIIKADAPRPSNPEIRTLFDGLLAGK